METSIQSIDVHQTRMEYTRLTDTSICFIFILSYVNVSLDILTPAFEENEHVYSDGDFGREHLPYAIQALRGLSQIVFPTVSVIMTLSPEPPPPPPP